MNEQKFTVIIPTRERCDVLEKSLQTVTAQNYDNLEIIVSDNCSCDATMELVNSIDDSRVRYINTARRVSMSQNWEFALSHVRDGWVTIVGDDDGLLPAALKKVSDVIRSTNTRAVRSSVCSYSWPSLTGKECGRLGVPLKSGYERRDSRRWLSKVLNGEAKYPELPMLYNGGFVDIEILKEINRRTGAVYRSCIPDVYSAVSIASVIDSYVYSNEPFAINGASIHSTGTAQFAVNGDSEVSPAKRFRSEGNIPFHKDIPLVGDGDYPPSIQAIVFESYLQSAPLRDGPLEFTHQQQLELILATAGRHSASMGEWGRTFASVHGLNYEAVQHRTKRRKMFTGVKSIPGHLYRAVNTYYLEAETLPLGDVYEASIAAGAIRHVMPQRVKHFQRLLARALMKVQKNASTPNRMRKGRLHPT